jgi:hypothetical protein
MTEKAISAIETGVIITGSCIYKVTTVSWFTGKTKGRFLRLDGLSLSNQHQRCGFTPSGPAPGVAGRGGIAHVVWERVATMEARL